MNRQEVTERFNALPREHRVTIIGNELDIEIRWLKSEKKHYIEDHAKNLNRINDRIERLERSLRDLKD